MEQPTDKRASILLAGEGPQIERSGSLVIRKAGGMVKGSMWVVEEMTFAPYSQCEMPSISDTTQVFYIVEGMLAFTVDEATITVTRGASVTVPQGLEHVLFNPTAAPAICLVVGIDDTLP